MSRGDLGRHFSTPERHPPNALRLVRNAAIVCAGAAVIAALVGASPRACRARVERSPPGSPSDRSTARWRQVDRAADPVPRHEPAAHPDAQHDRRRDRPRLRARQRLAGHPRARASLRWCSPLPHCVSRCDRMMVVADTIPGTHPTIQVCGSAFLCTFNYDTLISSGIAIVLTLALGFGVAFTLETAARRASCRWCSSCCSATSGPHAGHGVGEDANFVMPHRGDHLHLHPVRQLARLLPAADTRSSRRPPTST